MIKNAPDLVQKAKEVMGTKPVFASGYHLKIFPIPADQGLKAGEVEVAPTLAAKGLVVATERQKERETRGSDFAIIVHVGESAWKDDKRGLSGAWAKEGQVIRYLRYAGLEFEEPPGSGNVYRIINDEDVLGYYEEVVA